MLILLFFFVGILQLFIAAAVRVVSCTSHRVLIKRQFSISTVAFRVCALNCLTTTHFPSSLCDFFVSPKSHSLTFDIFFYLFFEMEISSLRKTNNRF